MSGNYLSPEERWNKGGRLETLLAKTFYLAFQPGITTFFTDLTKN